MLTLAPDAAAAAAGRGLATASRWQQAGWSASPPAVWGLCAGSGPNPYQTVVELAGPAYGCSCPSRKSPCKHALGLLLLWSAGGVPEAAPTDWADNWLAARAARAERAATRTPRSAGPADPEGVRRRAEQRAARVAAGVDELDRWLGDQLRTGLAGTEQRAYEQFDAIAARMVDAQASAVAGRLRGLAAVTVSGEGWPGRLLEEYAQLHLLAVAHRRLAELPDPQAATVRTRIGYQVGREEVLASPPVRDRWAMLAMRTEQDDVLTTRRVWLRGSSSGRPALVLSFAASGQVLDTGLVPGTSIDADLHFYPGAVPQRAVVGARHGEPGPLPPLPGVTIRQMLAEYAAALAADPWLTAWPAVLAGLVPVPSGDGGRRGWQVADTAGDGLPVAPDGPVDLWRLLAVSGGRPVTLAAEWTPRGLRPLSVLSGSGVVML